MDLIRPSGYKLRLSLEVLVQKPICSSHILRPVKVQLKIERWIQLYTSVMTIPPTDERELKCYACEEPLLQGEMHGDVYGCELCKTFFLHKSCAELPMEIVHKSHENHSLFLILNPPSLFSFNRCHLCGDYILNFFYYCYLCHFSLDIKCFLKEKESVVSVNKDLIVHHPSHKHPLMVQPRPSSFLCDACGVEDKDLLYHCSPCRYWIHKRCAMLPSTTLSDIHSHPLTLAFGQPSQYLSAYHNKCDICGNYFGILNQLWLYYCELCRIFFHIKCMTKKKTQIEVDLDGLIIEDLPHLPMTDKSVELIQRFLLENNSLTDIQPEISIFSHKHPLVYSNNRFIEEENEDGEEILCDACIEPIFSPPYYQCVECRYFLHLTCAKLPQHFQHPIHPHMLILSSETRFDETFICDRCEKESNGFFFYCATEGCGFHLDIKCAALPNTIKHEYHNHPLFQFFSESGRYCDCCGYFFDQKTYFGCKYCDFCLEVDCVLLPKTRRHKYDSKHPLILRFPPHSYHPEPFDCYQCELDINPYGGLYHCEESDLSFHIHCFNSAWRDYNMKFGQKVHTGCHPHPLKFVYKASVKFSKCQQCQDYNSYFTLECETCNFRLCQECVRNIESLS